MALDEGWHFAHFLCAFAHCDYLKWRLQDRDLALLSTDLDDLPLCGDTEQRPRAAVLFCGVSSLQMRILETVERIAR